MGLFGGCNCNGGANGARIARIERKVDLIMQSLGILTTDAEDNLDEVRDLMQTGRKIEAIKRYRELTGAGLAEAKQAVEAGV
jgi:ribosomal protein L7/L12